MADENVAFNDGAAYERFMGRWSRAVAGIFLDWAAPPADACWLDVGCGTGAFSEMIVRSGAAKGVVAIDPAQEQIEYARRLPIAQAVDFKVADAVNLPFADRSFDVVASALVINFIPDRMRALAEMRRVARPAGLVIGYVWDFANERSSGWPLVHGLRAIGIDPPPMIGAKESSVEGLQHLFEQAGLNAVETRVIEVACTFSDLDEYWSSKVPRFSPVGRLVAELSEARRQRLRDTVSQLLPAAADGSITYSAHANAVKARAPG